MKQKEDVITLSVIGTVTEKPVYAKLDDGIFQRLIVTARGGGSDNRFYVQVFGDAVDEEICDGHRIWVEGEFYLRGDKMVVNVRDASKIRILAEFDHGKIEADSLI